MREENEELRSDKDKREKRIKEMEDKVEKDKRDKEENRKRQREKEDVINDLRHEAAELRGKLTEIKKKKRRKR